MSQWTARTLQAAVVAAGVTAVGGGFVPSAEAAPAGPERAGIPDNVEVNLPVDGCSKHRAPEPCLDGGAHVAVPTLVKEVGGHVVRTKDGLARSARHGLSPQTAVETLGVVYGESMLVQETAKARPTVGVGVRPDNVAGFNRLPGPGGVLNAEVGPRGPNHEGVSAVDTAFTLDFVRGYAQDRPVNPARMVGKVVPVVREAPVVDRLLPQPRTSGPVRRTPALPSLDSAVHDTVGGATHNVATGVPQAPVDVVGMVSGS
ncbi:hypothetical protein [Saccharopolyspora taberi]|uniref:Uncharacterized protein n=1 Tax=Saccharopolyspora taberi TaxID=60895 RepID=A0ABN3VBU1_9PSEU